MLFPFPAVACGAGGYAASEPSRVRAALFGVATWGVFPRATFSAADGEVRRVKCMANKIAISRFYFLSSRPRSPSAADDAAGAAGAGCEC
jgi:hypothetical protein